VQYNQDSGTVRFADVNVILNIDIRNMHKK
jgi:hypothetical protein